MPSKNSGKMHSMIVPGSLRRFFLLAIAILLSAVVLSAQDADGIGYWYHPGADSTTVYVKAVTLPKNKKQFSVGAYFVVPGKGLDKRPCCVSLVFSSIGKKKFDYKNDHAVTFYADGKEMKMPDSDWREGQHATAFVVAGIAYPEEVHVQFDADTFLKLSQAKALKAKLGNFTFAFTETQKKALAARFPGGQE